MSRGETPADPGRPEEPAEPVPPAAGEEAYSAEEEDEVAARLEALGYLD
jgi:hypothetical protein